MTDAEERFARRLGEDLERVLGAGVAVADVELSSTDDQASVRATLFVEGRIQKVEVSASGEAGLYRPLIERAAELRLQSAFWRMIGPS